MAQGFGGRDDGSAQEQPERGAAADEARQALRAAEAGDYSQLDLWLAELCCVRGKAQGAGHGEFAAAAEGEAVDAGDDGFAEGFEPAREGLSAGGVGASGFCVEGGEFGDVGSGGEGFGAGAGEQEDANFGVGGYVFNGGRQFAEEGGVQGVQDLRAIERDGCEGRAFFAEDGLKAHGMTSQVV